MTCPTCDGKTRVIVTATSDTEIWRIRRCMECGDEMSTLEVQDEPPAPVRQIAIEILEERRGTEGLKKAAVAHPRERVVKLSTPGGKVT